jgi:integrase
MKFTSKTIDRAELPEGKTDHLEWDDELPGFGLRLRAGGSRNWIFQYALGDKQRRVTLGSAKAMTLVKARAAAQDMHAKVRLGQDPAGEKEEGRARASQTFEAMVKEYLIEKRPNMKPRPYKAVERHLLKYAKPLHGLQMAKIDRHNIASLLTKITMTAGKPDVPANVSANRTRASLSAFFPWAISGGVKGVSVNPVAGTVCKEEHSRDRVLKSHELAAIWKTLSDDHYGSIVKLLMLTGQRADEIASLRWSEIGADAITLPAARTKNKRQHVVPLTSAALTVLQAQSRRVNADGSLREFVFGIGQHGFAEWSYCKARLDARLAETLGTPLPHWTQHDLRRSVATGMADIGVQPHIIEAMLNHYSGHKAGVAGIYNRSSYEPEKRQALAMWADHLMAAIEGRTGNVTPMRRPA